LVIEVTPDDFVGYAENDNEKNLNLKQIILLNEKNQIVKSEISAKRILDASVTSGNTTYSNVYVI
jgi:hypothetical protein